MRDSCSSSSSIYPALARIYSIRYVCLSSPSYLFPSLLTAELGTSKRQLGQYQYSTSSVKHLGHLMASHSSQ